MSCAEKRSRHNKIKSNIIKRSVIIDLHLIKEKEANNGLYC
jgi:hypothetical protein